MFITLLIAIFLWMRFKFFIVIAELIGCPPNKSAGKQHQAKDYTHY